MEADGSFPLELKRTKPYGYSIFQLDNMATLCQILSTPTDNLWNFELPDGRGIRKAVAYLYPFLADKSKWPLKPDIQAWDGWPARQSNLLFAGLALGDSKYLDLWKKLSPDPSDPEVKRNIAITQPLLWLAVPPTQSSDNPKPDVAAIDRARIIKAADAALTHAPTTITTDVAKNSTGGPNDFFSNADYFWPDPTKPGGLPYISRDGESNPENFNKHRMALRNLRDAVAALGAAYQVTSDDRYAAKAAELLRVFFLDPATRMNPHLNFAQAVLGVTPGRSYGIIDTLHLIEVPPAITAMQKSPAFSPEVLAGLKKWFRDYTEWMLTSKNGIIEGSAKNNHAVAFWLQVAAFARFTGDESALAEARRKFKEVFLVDQMALDGSFPLELKRTKPYAYSIFQFDNMSTLCQILSTKDDNLWTFELPDGRGIRKAVAYLYPYLADKSKWPLKPDIEAWESWPARQSGLLFAGIALGENKYLDLWQKLSPDPTNPEVQRNIGITQPLLWLK